MNTKHLLALLASCAAGHFAAQGQQPPPPADTKPPEAVRPADPPPPPPQPQEKERHPQPPAQEQRKELGRDQHYRDSDRPGTPRDRHHGPQPEMKLTSYIGVMTRSVSPEVRAQTGLEEGFGLLVEEILPDSPAQHAGLQRHDILVLLGDQRLVNLEQLTALVRAEKKDTQLQFTIRRGGSEQKLTIKVGERMMPVAFDPQPGDFHPFAIWGKDGERLGHQFREGMERFRDGVKEFQERVQDWARSAEDGTPPRYPYKWHDRSEEPARRPQNDRDKNDERRPDPGRPDADDKWERRVPPPRQDGAATSDPTRNQSGHAAADSSKSFQRNIVRRDDSGEYILRDDDGARLFIVKPLNGEEQTFIINTEEQRRAIPEPFRVKLRELDNVGDRIPVDPNLEKDTKDGA